MGRSTTLKKSNYISIAAFMIAAVVLSAHAEDRLREYVWRKDRFSAIKILAFPDNGLALIGHARIWRLDSKGNLLWDRNFQNEPGFLWFTGGSLLSDGSLIIVGSKDAVNSEHSDLWILKLNAGGRLQWEKTYGGSGPDFPKDITVFPEGGLAVAGETQSKEAGVGDFWIVRTNAAGVLLWEKTYGGKKRDSATTIVSLADNDMAVAGFSYSKGAGNSDVWLMRLDARGKVRWERTFGNQGHDTAVSMLALPDNSLVIAGNSDHSSFILCLNENGEKIWEKPIQSNLFDEVTDLTRLADGTFVLSGFTSTQGLSSSSGWVIGLGASGQLKWQRSFGESGRDRVDAIAALPDGHLVVSGSTLKDLKSGWKSWLIKFVGD